MSKYEDLTRQIADDLGFADGTMAVAGISLTLEWLDDNPKELPGKRVEVSESTFRAIVRDSEAYLPIGRPSRLQIGRAIFQSADFSIVPNPEPTEAEKLAEVIREYTYHSEPQALAEALVRAGVTAPKAGDDDEQ